MSYKVFARKYRPQTFDEVESQTHIITTLENSIASGKISHAYLFSGMRGVGKTTVARLFSKGLNCKEGPTITPCNRCSSCVDISRSGGSVDVAEIDGASNNSVEDVREIIERVQYKPLNGRFKVFIIDEVHMLSNSAFNALLKTIEEPPSHCIFIFATTEAHKIPTTISSRCQHFVFKRIPFKGLLDKLGAICKAENIKADENGLSYIARISDGSLRDALGLLDQVVSFADGIITEDTVTEVFGLVDMGLLFELGDSILKGDASSTLELVGSLSSKGLNVTELTKDLAGFFRNLSVASLSDKPEEIVELAPQDLVRLKEVAKKHEAVRITRLFNLFMGTADSIKASFNPQYSLELAAIKGTSYKDIITLAEARKLLNEEISSKNEINHTSDPATNKNMARPMITEPATRSSFVPQGVKQACKPEPDSSMPQKNLPACSPQREPDTISSYTKQGDNKAILEIDWPAIIQEVGNIKRRLRSELESCDIIKCTDKKIALGVKTGASFMLENLNRQESKDTILAVIHKRYGIRPLLEITMLEPSPSSTEEHKSVGAEVKKKRQAELDEKIKICAEDPVVKQVLEVFDGSKIIPNHGITRLENDA